MSLIKSATHRLSLLAGSSLIVVAATVAAALTPTAAHAQAVCAPPPSSGAGSSTVAYDAGTYATGINCTAVGNLDLTVVAGSGSTVSNFGTGGIVASAGPTPSDPDDVIVHFTGAVSPQIANYSTPFPKLIDAQSRTGDVLIDLALFRGNGPFVGFLDVRADNAATTHAVYAVSHVGGDVVVQTTSPAGLTMRANGASSIAAVEARSVGGGDVTIQGAADGTSFTGGQHGIWAVTDGAGDILIDLNGGRGTGRLYGIRAAATGTGTLTIEDSDGRTTGSTGLYGIHATTGSGLLTINGTAQATSSSTATGVYIDAGGDVDFTGSASGGAYGIYVEDVLDGTTTNINLTGNATGGTRGILAAGAGDLLVNVVGTVGLHNYDFSGMAAPVEVTVREDGIWRSATSSTVAGSNYDITIEAGGGLIAGTESNGFEAPTVITFAVPDLVLTNAGFLIVGPMGSSNDAANHEGNLWFEGLGEFRHSGTVVLGAFGGNSAVSHTRLGTWAVDTTDGVPDDILTMVGGTWVGEEGRVMFDVDFTASQSDCSRDPVTGSMAAADCLRLPGVTTEGVTYVTINEVFPGDRIRPPEEGIVLVEVTGGTSAQGHFTIAPDAIGHTDLFGGSQDRGLYHYVIGYNEDTQQHALYGFVGAGSYQFAQYATAAHSLWRTSTGTWLDRQADLRGGIDAGVGGGVWMRTSGEITERDVAVDNVAGGRTFTFDNTHEQKSYAVTGGLDLISASADDTAWVVGLMTGYATSEVAYDAWANTGQLDGFSAGAYTSFVSGGLFVDAAVNANRMILKNDMPGLNIFPAGSILDTIVVSVGGQVEAGYRFPVADFAFVEPLAGASYVRSKYDDLEIAASDPIRPGVTAQFDDPTSLRASIGGRVGVDHDFGFLRAQFSVLGRVWNEFEGENRVLLDNQGVVDTVVDDFSGQFNELGLGVSVYSPGGAVSGFLSLGGKFGDDYQAKTGTVGVRVAW